MNKVLNAIFGIAVGILVYLVIILGINAFYPEPDYNDFCPDIPQPILDLNRCSDDMLVKDCRVMLEQDRIVQETQDECYRQFDSAREKYNTTYFIVAAIFGLLVVISAMFMLKMTAISSGVIMSGIILIFWSFMRTWDATNDKLKFVVALIDLTIIAAFAVYTWKKK